jgi:hypothetical protein
VRLTEASATGADSDAAHGAGVLPVLLRLDEQVEVAVGAVR